MKKWLMTAWTAVVFLSGCGAEESPSASVDQKASQSDLHKNGMPEAMPSDFDFSVRYGYGMKDEINTYENTVTKDLVVKGAATADITLSEEEMGAIYAKMKAIDVIHLTKLNPTTTNCAQTPFNQASWMITIASNTQSLTWSSEHCTVTDDARKLLDLQTYIQGIVKGKPAYKALPEAEGGYD
ncbi:hypothetical protein [Paenibacillus sacheonensis]|uniref:Uncharacterized protein n=1 Tax=Paenibacillus sacheonensis TaxID=742054 RepID=A0A7X4YLC3_9BACL|nr:hypothetical protein [Paenibacillus sacheonensis]MBM7563876.1 hypothetical protein [Paenibacillus sacheonensis]NBC67776.1 hypothetical protein [Paenibacillus sacheonensis]